MNACKTKRRIKRRNLDKRAKYSTILKRWVLKWRPKDKKSVNLSRRKAGKR